MHPEGGRSFNCRELACLMTFPLYYQFAGGITAIKLQIGNAVPPVVMKAICEEVLRSLRKSDEEMGAWRPEVVVLEDEDEDSVDGDCMALSEKKRMDVPGFRWFGSLVFELWEISGGV